MQDLLAKPWWVNLLLAVPVLVSLRWRRPGLQLSWGTLTALGLFAAAFGFVEAAVVVYLRAATGLLPGYMGTLADIRKAAADYQQLSSLNFFPHSLLTIEIGREAATMVMLASVAWVAGSTVRQRLACFLWAFAVWDLIYYAGLWATVGWPQSLTTKDILFLIPTPWISQVWFPILVSGLTIAAIALVNQPRDRKAVVCAGAPVITEEKSLETAGN